MNHSSVSMETRLARETSARARARARGFETVPRAWRRDETSRVEARREEKRGGEGRDGE